MMAQHILIGGPPSAKTFLENLGVAVGDDDAIIECRFDLNGPSDYPDWNKVTIFVAFGLPCSADDMRKAPGLRAIITPSLGYEGIDTNAAAKRGIAFANGRVAENYESVSEAAMMFMLMALYRVKEAEERAARDTPRSGPPTARMLKGKTIGIIGYGNIAQALIRRLHGWENRILVRNRSKVDCPAGVEQSGLENLLRESDIVLPLVPLTNDTEGLLSKERLLAMKPGTILLNLSRGAIIDETALCDPGVSAHLGTIVLDVFVTEPLPLDSPLRNLPDRILTNHEISHTQENLRALFDMVVANIQAAIKGRPLPTALSGQAGGAPQAPPAIR